ncbi:hypothetical protein SAMN05216339_101338 [Nitrosomonas eutropha]|uniref:Uncharacterized protein n=1 Tax=Nitrosomonas eutropha TaxID=916 RepID=A0A1I7F7V0_9PROT|nr:hypothetical protein [Nitrosomonas eutropha]SFU32257.1 hypothetical protein SAMN05216339_101338 [Nitrosomonas eutropha]
MQHFEIGVLSFVFAITLPVIYFIGYQVRRLGAWSKREARPGDRIGFFLIMALVLGFVFGSFAQPLWSAGVSCHAAGQPVVPCVLNLGGHV